MEKHPQHLLRVWMPWLESRLSRQWQGLQFKSNQGVFMVIAVSGSRNLNQAQIKPNVSTIMCSAGKSVSWAIGCCPSGLDPVALSVARQNRLQFSFFQAANRSPACLRARTLSMVNSAAALIAFPVSGSVVRSGTWLAVKAAALVGKKVFVHFPGSSSSHLPIFGNIASWRLSSPSFLPNCQFWVPVCHSIQTQLF